MKKQILCSMSLAALAFSGTLYAAIPAVNEYKIVKRPIAVEPAPSQYTVSANDVGAVQKPPFPYYTQLNFHDRKELYMIPPFPYTSQLPQLGKWMVAVAKDQKKLTYVPSHWLDDKSASGQYIIEPINYVFVVYGKNEATAIKTLKHALVDAGFTMKWSGAAYHSGNYHAYMNNQLLSQLKRKDGVFITFSDDDWLNENDHFRVMGPFKTEINGKTAFLFASSVSEESAWNEPLYAGHFYVSFTHARNSLANGLVETGHSTYYVELGNVLNTLGETTEDHDGKVFVTVI